MHEEPARKLTIYVDEQMKHHHKPLYEVLLDLLNRNGIRGASVFRGISGYGADRVMHTSKIIELSTDLPLKLEAVDSAEKIEAVLPQICGMVDKGLVEISDTTIVNVTLYK